LLIDLTPRTACAGKIGTMTLPNLGYLSPEQLHALAAQLMQRVQTLDHQVDTLSKTVETMARRSPATKQ